MRVTLYEWLLMTPDQRRAVTSINAAVADETDPPRRQGYDPELGDDEEYVGEFKDRGFRR